MHLLGKQYKFMSNKTPKTLFDFLYVIIAITYKLSILGNYTIDTFMNLDYNLGIYLFLVLGYLIRFQNIPNYIKFVERSKILKLFFLSYIVGFLGNYAYRGIGAIVSIVACVGFYFFIGYLYNIYNLYIERYSTDKIKNILTPYFIYSFYNIVVILIVSFLILMNLIDYRINPLDNNISLFAGHSSFDLNHYFPLNLSLVLDYNHIFSLWDFPVVTGLSHEPHILGFMMVPSLFFVLSYNVSNKIKYILLIIYTFIVIEISSTTVFLACIIIIAIEIFYRSSISKSYLSLSIIVLFITFLLVQFDFLTRLIWDEIMNKTTGDSTSSMDYSVGMLEYVFTPTTLLGYGNMPPELGSKLRNYDIGFLSSLIDIAILYYFIKTAMRMIIKKDTFIHFMGMGCLYFILHGQKLYILLYSYPYFAMFIFIVALYETGMLEIPSCYAKKSIEI